MMRRMFLWIVIVVSVIDDSRYKIILEGGEDRCVEKSADQWEGEIDQNSSNIAIMDAQEERRSQNDRID